MVHLLIRGTEYKETSEDTGEVTIKHCDDDRYRFCNDDLATAYFWGCVEMIGLATFAMQNIQTIGLVPEEGVGSARAAGRATVSANMTDRQKHRDTIEQAIASLPEAMEKSMGTFLDKDHQAKELNQAEDHHRKANALFNCV